ncbi:MAG: metallophosphoesterase family protein [Thermoplasmatota archaeon]
MRFLHVSDTHIGFAAYSRVTPDGLNQREQDFFEAFRRVVDLAIDERVDAVLHTGDIFDSVRPTNRAVTFAMSEVRRLGDAGIPFVAIAGNHEAPKLRETGSVIRFFEFLPNAHVAFRGEHRAVRIGDVAFHLVPHAASNEALAEQVAKARPDPDAAFNVLALHAGVVGVGDFRTGEFNEQVVPEAAFAPEWDYVALGHYHRHASVRPNAYYAGSTERSSFAEAAEEKGVVLVNTAAGSVAERVRFIPMATRPMLALPSVDARALAELKVAPAVYRALADAPLSGAIARLNVTGIPPAVYATLDFARIRKLTEPAVHVALSFEIDRAGAGGADAARASFGTLADEFRSFVATVPLPEASRPRVERAAVAFLAEAEAGEGA